jgi:hypothetical protein
MVWVTWDGRRFSTRFAAYDIVYDALPAGLSGCAIVGAEGILAALGMTMMQWVICLGIRR